MTDPKKALRCYYCGDRLDCIACHGLAPAVRVFIEEGETFPKGGALDKAGDELGKALGIEAGRDA